MPHRNWELRIADIREAIETVLEYTAGMTFEQFVSDRKTIDAVILNIGLILVQRVSNPIRRAEKRSGISYKLFHKKAIRTLKESHLITNRDATPIYSLSKEKKSVF